MARKYEIVVHNDDRRLKLDMTGCKNLGEKPELPAGMVPKEYISICWTCRRPVGDCPWLLEGRPAKGSSYYWWKPVYGDDCEPAEAYIITYCPKHIPPDA